MDYEDRVDIESWLQAFIIGTFILMITGAVLLDTISFKRKTPVCGYDAVYARLQRGQPDSVIQVLLWITCRGIQLDGASRVINICHAVSRDAQ